MSVSRHTSYNLIGSIIPLLGSLITVPIYVHLIGPARYGVLAIAWLLLGYFGLFDLGLGRATSFRISALREASAEARANTFWAAIIVNLGMGVIGAAILWLGADYFFAHMFKVEETLRPEIMASVPLLALSVPIATLSGVLTGALQGREQFLQTNVISVISAAMFQLLPLWVVWQMGPNLVQVLSAAVLAKVLTMAALALGCHLALTRGQPIRLDRREAPMLLKYGGWITLTSLFGPMLVIVDRFVIGAVLGAVAVAIYTIPYQLAKQIQILPSALTNALFPKISAATAEEQTAYSRNATFALVSLISLPVLGAIFLLEPALQLWVGKSMGGQAAPVGRILLVGFWANAFAMIPYTGLQASGRPDLVTKMLLIEIPPYFLILYLGLTYFGVSGAALALAVRSVIDYCLLSWVAKKGFAGWPVLTANLVLLTIGAFIAGVTSINDWRWWAGALAVGSIMLTLAWLNAPTDVRSRLANFRPHLSRKPA